MVALKRTDWVKKMIVKMMMMKEGLMIQYLVWPPSLARHISILRGMDLASFLHKSWLTSWTHMKFSRCLRWSLFRTDCLDSFAFMIDQRFSIGLRSGELPGQSIKLMFWALIQFMEYREVWHGAPSCKKL